MLLLGLRFDDPTWFGYPTWFGNRTWFCRSHSSSSFISQLFLNLLFEHCQFTLGVGSLGLDSSGPRQPGHTRPGVGTSLRSCRGRFLDQHLSLPHSGSGFNRCHLLVLLLTGRYLLDLTLRLSLARLFGPKLLLVTCSFAPRHWYPTGRLLPGLVNICYGNVRELVGQVRGWRRF